MEVEWKLLQKQEEVEDEMKGTGKHGHTGIGKESKLNKFTWSRRKKLQDKDIELRVADMEETQPQCKDCACE